MELYSNKSSYNYYYFHSTAKLKIEHTRTYFIVDAASCSFDQEAHQLHALMCILPVLRSLRINTSPFSFLFFFFFFLNLFPDYIEKHCFVLSIRYQNVCKRELELIKPCEHMLQPGSHTHTQVHNKHTQKKKKKSYDTMQVYFLSVCPESPSLHSQMFFNTLFISVFRFVLIILSSSFSELISARW